MTSPISIPIPNLTVMKLAALVFLEGSHEPRTARRIHAELDRLRLRSLVSTRVALQILFVKGLVERTGGGEFLAYRITPAGREALRSVRDFYREIDGVGDGETDVDAGDAISHLHVAILRLIASGERPGRDVRAELKARGWRTSDAGFYLIVNKLEKQGLLVGRYAAPPKQLTTAARERLYTISGDGLRALRRSTACYRQILAPLRDTRTQILLPLG